MPVERRELGSKSVKIVGYKLIALNPLVVVVFLVGKTSSEVRRMMKLSNALGLRSQLVQELPVVVRRRMFLQIFDQRHQLGDLTNRTIFCGHRR